MLFAGLCTGTGRRWRRACLPVVVLAGGLVALFVAPPAAQAKPGAWHRPGGTVIEGELAEVFGGTILVAGRNANALLPVGSLTDDELRIVAEFLAAQPSERSWQNSRSKVTAALRGRLQIVREGRLVDFAPPAGREPDLYLVYFSAGWCGPCHQFTPKLVEAYQRLQQALPGRVEVVFVSNDRNASEQSDYARSSGMPWPMLRYSDLGKARVIERWAGNGIPCLVAVTRDGEVVFHSYRGEEYLGPQHVLQASTQLLASMVADTAVARRDRHRLAVLQHVRSVGSGNSAPKPYAIVIDRPKYGAIEIPAVTFRLQVDAQGKVIDAALDQPVGPDLERLLLEDAATWLFLPGIEQGQPCAKSVRIPFKGTASKT